MANNTDLDEEDIRLLMETLDALERQDESKLFSSTLMGLMLARSEKQAEEVIASAEQQGAEARQKRELFSERIILLKAKLIQMKDKALARALEGGAE